MAAPICVLGIETSCDETAAAVLRCAPDGTVTILSETVHSQIDEHAPYGGVVPEIAARAHADIADAVVAKTLQDSGIELADLDAIAATSGPGLIGGVMVGMMTGKAMALAAIFMPSFGDETNIVHVGQAAVQVRDDDGPRLWAQSVFK